MIMSVKQGESYDITSTHTRTYIESLPPMALTINSTMNGDNFDVGEIENKKSNQLKKKEMETIVKTFRWFSFKKILSGISPQLDPVFMPLAFQTMSIYDALSELDKEPASFLTGLAALGTAVDTISKMWQGIVSIFKSTTSVTLQRLIRFGFEHFKMDSRAMMLKGFPMDKLDTLADYIFKRFSVPDSMKIERDDIIMFGFAEDGSVWDQMSTLFSKDSRGNCNHLQILKNPTQDRLKSNWVITGFESDFNIAPDIIVKTTAKSRFGGLFESTKTEFIKTPHMLTLEETIQITKFLEIVAYGRVASELGLKVNWPEIK